MTNPTRRIVPAEATAIRNALEAMIRAHETGRYEPQQAAYEYAKNTLHELAASPASGKVTREDVEKMVNILFPGCRDTIPIINTGTGEIVGSMPSGCAGEVEMQEAFSRVHAALASLGLEVE